MIIFWRLRSSDLESESANRIPGLFRTNIRHNQRSCPFVLVKRPKQPGLRFVIIFLGALQPGRHAYACAFQRSPAVNVIVVSSLTGRGTISEWWVNFLPKDLCSISCFVEKACVARAETRFLLPLRFVALVELGAPRSPDLLRQYTMLERVKHFVNTQKYHRPHSRHEDEDFPLSP